MSDQEDNQEEQIQVDPKKEKLRIKEILESGLQQIAKTADNSGYAMVTLKCPEKEIGPDLYSLVSVYRHVRYLDLSRNGLVKVDGLQDLDYLVYLNLRANAIINLKFLQERNKLKYLQCIDLQENMIQELEDVSCSSLTKLNLNGNKIDRCVLFTGHKTIKILEIRKNQLTDLRGLANMPQLEELYLAENQIDNIAEIKNVPKLSTLFLRQNNIKSLEFPNMNELQSVNRINLRGNQIESFKQLQSLLKLSNLQNLNILQNPVTEEGDSAKKEVLMILSKLRKVNKEEVSSEEVQEAANELKERLLAEEEKRREEEEKRREEEEERRREEEEKRKAEEEEQQ